MLVVLCFTSAGSFISCLTSYPPTFPAIFLQESAVGGCEKCRQPVLMLSAIRSRHIQLTACRGGGVQRSNSQQTSCASDSLAHTVLFSLPTALCLSPSSTPVETLDCVRPTCFAPCDNRWLLRCFLSLKKKAHRKRLSAREVVEYLSKRGSTVTVLLPPVL